MSTTANSDGTALASSIWAAQQLMADDDQMITDQQIEQLLCELAEAFIRLHGATEGTVKPHHIADQMRRGRGCVAHIHVTVTADYLDGWVSIKITADRIRVVATQAEQTKNGHVLDVSEWRLTGDAMSDDLVGLLRALVAGWKGGGLDGRWANSRFIPQTLLRAGADSATVHVCR